MSEHILLIDDDALLRRSLAFSLENAGYQVTVATDAEAGLALLDGLSPQLLLLDMGLLTTSLDLETTYSNEFARE